MGTVLDIRDYTPKSERVLKNRIGARVSPNEIIDEYYRLKRLHNIKLLENPKGYITKIPELPSLPDTFTTGKYEQQERIKENLRDYTNQIELYKRKPTYFVKQELGIAVKPFYDDLPRKNYTPSLLNPLPLWTRQVEILNALVKYRKVTVKSGHGSGKTFIAAVATLYLAYVWKALGITTAPTGRQVKRLLWGEITKIWNHADSWQKSNGRPGLGGRLLTTSLELGDKWFVEGFSTDSKESNIPGFHADTIFVIIDEAGGVDPIVFQLFETILNSENVFVLLIGNPIDPNTEFKKTFDPKSEFYPITISCFDTPNVKHRQKIYPALCARYWPRRMKKKWGSKSPFYRSRVLGEFPFENTDGLIPYNKVIAAKERDLPDDGEIIAIGADVARLGGDRAIAGQRWSNGRYREILSRTKRRTTEFTGKLISLYSECNKHNKNYFEEIKKERTDEEKEVRTPTLNIDDIGVGGGVTDMLLENNLPANGINVAERVETGVFGDEQGLVKYKNKRAYYYDLLKKAFIEDRVDIDPMDDELEQEILAIEVKYTSKGEMQIIEKDAIKKKLGGRSPDKVEAMMLAFAESDYLDAADMMVW